RSTPDTGRAELPRGIGFVPQDRTTEGLALAFDLTENVALAFHDRGRGAWMRWPELRRRTAGLIERFDVHARGPGVPARTLSGGNQQKLVVGRELEVADDLLVAENPTRGLDVGTARAVHEALLALI